ADVVAADAEFDVLESLGGNLEIDEALELLGADAEEAIQDPSVTIERLLRRIAPTQDRLESVAPAARERLKELGLPDEASSSVVGRLLDTMASRKADAAGRQLGSFRTDEATREKRRAEGEDLFALLDEDVMWRARVSVCLEVLETAQDADAYLTTLDAVESSLARIQEGNGRASGIALRVVSALREKQQSPELPQHCRQRTTEALAKLESTGGVESVKAALTNASGPERGQLIALLADLGAGGLSALYEMLREKSCRADLPIILASLARLEREGVKPTEADYTEDHSDPAAVHEDSPDASTEQEQSEEPDFRSLLLDPRWENAAAAVECLAAQGTTFATKYLSISLAQGYLALRAAVIQALTTSPSSEALDLLIYALDNSEPDIQEMAAASLGHIRDPRVAVALMKVAEPKGLLDKRTRLRAAAMIALGSLGCTAAFDMLARTLRHRPLFRREAGAELSAAAATALGRLGTERARAALERGISDRRPVVQQACHKALAEAAAEEN
ncbi:MAG: HEAT repeat domain-containing protein, partial [Armatimonadota bacterium]